MHITKPLITKLTLRDVNVVYNPNVKEVCMSELQRIYVGNCFNSSLILGIKSIDNYSLRRFNSALDGSANISVQATTDAIIYLPGEIIADCKIIRIEENKICLESKYANVQVTVDKSTSHWTAGEIVPIVVLYARHLPSTQKISIIGSPLLKTKYLSSFNLVSGICYHIVEAIQEVESQVVPQTAGQSASQIARQSQIAMQSLISEITDVQNQIAKLPAESVQFFTELLSTSQSEPSSVIRTVSLLKELKPGYYLRGQVKFNSPLLQYFEKMPPDAKMCIDDSNENHHKLLLNQYLHNLHSIKALSETYASRAAFDAKKRTWQEYKSSIISRD